MGRRKKEVAVSELKDLSAEELDNLNELTPDEIDNLADGDIATLESVGIDAKDIVIPVSDTKPVIVDQITLKGVVRQILNIKQNTRVGVIDMDIRGVAPLNVIIPENIAIGDVVHIDVYK